MDILRLTSNKAAFIAGVIAAIYNKDLDKHSTLAQSDISVVPDLPLAPMASLELVDGSLLSFSSPYFGGFACYSPYQQKIFNECYVDYEILSIGGMSKRLYDSLMQGSTIGSIIGAGVSIALASTTAGYITGGLGILLGLALLIWDSIEKQKQENLKWNLAMAQNICLSHISIINVAYRFAELNLFALPTDGKIKLMEILTSKTLNHIVETKSQEDGYKTSLIDYSDVYYEYNRLLDEIVDFKMEYGLLPERSKPNLREFGIELDTFITNSPKLKTETEAKRLFSVVGDIAIKCNYRSSAYFGLEQNNRRFAYIVNKPGHYEITNVSSKEEINLEISPIVSAIPFSQLKSYLMSEELNDVNVIKETVAGVEAEASLVFKGVMGIELLKTESSYHSAGEAESLQINEFIRITKLESPLYDRHTVLPDGTLVKQGFKLSSYDPFKVSATDSEGVLLTRQSYFKTYSGNNIHVRLLALLPLITIDAIPADLIVAYVNAYCSPMFCYGVYQLDGIWQIGVIPLSEQALMTGKFANFDHSVLGLRELACLSDSFELLRQIPEVAGVDSFNSLCSLLGTVTIRDIPTLERLEEYVFEQEPDVKAELKFAPAFANKVKGLFYNPASSVTPVVRRIV